MAQEREFLIEDVREREVEDETSSFRTGERLIDDPSPPSPREDFPIDVSDDSTFEANLEQVQAHPNFFDNLSRIHGVTVAEELGKRGAEIILPEVGGAIETTWKMISGFAVQGLGAMGSLWDAMGQIGPVVKIGGENVVDLSGQLYGGERKTFADQFISGQAKISAAYGRFYDYEPLMETTERNMEVLGNVFEKVAAAGEFLGNETLEHTESPLLATAARLVPDGVLAALPFMPKGIRAMREANAVRRLERAVVEDAMEAAKNPRAIAPTNPVLDYSSLTESKMPVATLNNLKGGAAVAPEVIAQLADDLRAGKASGEIIVETVQGAPVGIISGVEVLEAAQLAAQNSGLRIKNMRVKLQERETHTQKQLEDLETQASNGIDDILENQAKLELTEQSQNKSIWQRLVHSFVDTSGNVKAELIKSFGPAGEAAVMDFALKAGATPKAHMMFQDFHNLVYGRRGPSDPGISYSRSIEHLGARFSETDLFNILVQSRRTLAIVKSGGAKATGEGRFQLSGAVKPENAAGNIWAIRNTLGEQRFAQLTSRADDVFETLHRQLDRLRDEGIITPTQYRRMQGIDYIKREFVEAIDPIMADVARKGVALSIGESGIFHLKGGSKAAQVIDVQSLVAEYLARTEGRIFRNQANKSLYNLAKNQPDNGLVILPKSAGTKLPEGFTELKVMIDGEAQRMFMKDVYASEWIINDAGMNVAMANMFSIINGTFVVKPLATGINPAFALVNFPRDIHHAWKATGNQYSAFLPRYIGQIIHDMWEVRSDVWNKTGAYRDFVNEGGGMNFLTHGGFDPLTGFSRSKDLYRAVGVHRGKFGENYTRLKEVLSKVNEASELIVRLAIRNRVIKNQVSSGRPVNSKEATFIARDYLDFSQGGSITKAMESFIPYTNAASQAIRTALREYNRGGRQASVAALKDLQIVGLKAGVSAWSWQENPEVMAQIDPHQSYANVVFPTGLSYVDNRNNRRHVYVPIAMDTTILPFTALLDRLISKHALLATGIDPDDVPSTHLLGEIAQVVPILGSLETGTPTFQALAALLANKDLWANRDIWTGDPFVMPGARRDEGTAGTVFDTLGSIAPEVVSPVQLQKAWRTYVPSNFYIDSSDFIRKQIQRASDPVAYAELMQNDLSTITLDMLAQIPGLNRVIHVTHPAAQTTPELRTLAKDVATWREIERQAVDAAVRKHLVLGDSSDFARIIDRVVSVRPQDAERVKDLFITSLVTETMYKENDYDIGFVGQDWFNLLAGQDPETRAELYYWKWVSLSNENATNLNAVIAQIDKVGGKRIRTDEFDNSLKRIIAQFGTREQRIRAVMDGQ